MTRPAFLRPLRQQPNRQKTKNLSPTFFSRSWLATIPVPVPIFSGLESHCQITVVYYASICSSGHTLQQKNFADKARENLRLSILLIRPPPSCLLAYREVALSANRPYTPPLYQQNICFLECICVFVYSQINPPAHTLPYPVYRKHTHHTQTHTYPPNIPPHPANIPYFMYGHPNPQST